MQQALESASNYYTVLGLEFDPFAAGAMPDFFFVGAQRRFLVQRAVQALYITGATVVLLGENGSGKTRTIDEIEKELLDLADICRVEATVLMDAVEIRLRAGIVLGLPQTVATGNAEFVQALERVRPTHAEAQPLLMVIDSAHLLSIAALLECVALVRGAGGRLRLLLAGERDLAQSWQQAEAGVAEVLDLPALNRTETEDFVRTKLLAAGLRDLQTLNAVPFEEIFTLSAGNFSAINNLLPKYLTPRANSAPTAAQEPSFLAQRIIAGVIFFTSLIALIVYRSSESVAPLPNIAAVQVEASRDIAADKNNQTSIALQLPATATQAQVSSTSAAIETPTSAPVQATVPTQVAAPASAATPSLPTQAVAPPAGKTESEKKEPIKNDSVKNALVKKEVAKTGTGKAEPAPAHEKTAMTAQSESGKIKSIEKNKKDIAHGRDEAALLALPSSHFVLQLVGVGSGAAADAFIAGHQKSLALYQYRTVLKGKPWFIVVGGSYPSKEAAVAAVSTLPESLRNQKPWARSVANVQADIRTHAAH